jgi:hypothetical protein
MCREPHGPDTGVRVRHPSHRNPQPSHQPGDKEGKSVGFILFIFESLLIYFFVRPGTVLWIRIRLDLNLSAVSGSGKIQSDPSSSKSEMNLK